MRCELCKRDKELTFHHLIPKTFHSRKWFKKNFKKADKHRGINICQDCHSAIHKFASEKELGRRYNTKELLMEHEEIKKFVEWVSKRHTKDRHKTL